MLMNLWPDIGMKLFVDGPAETVVYRIFYHVNRAGNGRLQLREIKRSNLVAALQQVDEEEDINKVLRYGSMTAYWLYLNLCMCFWICIFVWAAWCSYIGYQYVSLHLTKSIAPAYMSNCFLLVESLFGVKGYRFHVLLPLLGQAFQSGNHFKYRF